MSGSPPADDADHPIARAALAAAGWTRGRRVDAGAAVAALTEDGYEVPPEIEAFIVEFAGLELVSARGDRLTIDPQLAVEQNFRRSVEEYGSLVGLDLYPMGEAGGGYMVALRSPAGSWFLAIDWTVVVLGHSDLEAFEAFAGDSPPTYVRT